MNLADWIDRRAAFAPEKTAIRFEGRELSYAAMAQQIAALAGALRGELGIRAGDRVAYLGYNSPDMIVLLFACARVGAIFLPLNWRLAPPEQHHIARDCRPTAFFTGGEFADSVEATRDQVGRMHYVSYTGPRAGWLDYQALLEAASPMAGNEAGAGYETPVLLCYTSGTTGKPKGAVLDQNALLFAAINSHHMHDLTSEDRVLSTLPLFHVGGLNIQTLPTFHAGGTVTLHAMFDPQKVLDTIIAEQITLSVLVPAQLQAMMALPGWQAADLSSLRCISTGSTLIPHALIEAIHARGIPLIQVYGSTETSPIVVFQTRFDAHRKAGSTGLPALHSELRIVDSEGRDLPAGEPGEILIRGPNVMRGYWQNPEATAEALRDGWYYTGDIGHVDSEGFLYVDDRKKDLIISGGENVYPAELENLLADHPAIRESAVVGRPDAKWGEVPVAVVALHEGAGLDKVSVIEYFDGKLARFKHPRDVLFVDQLPRNSMGKIQKELIRELVAGEVQQGESA